MLSRTVDRGSRFLRLIGLALYTFFLLTAPFEHHDFGCELRTPQHCTSCVSSQFGSDPHTPAIIGRHLADAGRVVSTLVISPGVLLADRTTGRSPPRLP